MLFCTTKRAFQILKKKRSTGNRIGIRILKKTMITESECITPEPTKYTITFESNGGSKVENITVRSGSTATEPEKPTYANHKFLGWYKEVELINLFDFNSEQIKSNITLYAKWTDVYKVTFKSGESDVESIIVTSGDKVEKPTDPAARTDYKFEGWYKDNNTFKTAFNFDTEIITENIVLYAKWKSLFIKIAAGYSHSLALKSNGELWAWGWNANGQLGDGTTTDVLTPKKIGDGYIQISAGYAHSLALKKNGELWAWGWNADGQLGDGTNANVPAPKKIGDGYIQISAGYAHSLALKNGGELWAWGLNANGQLGDGTSGINANKNIPTRIGKSVVEYTQIAASQTHSLALKSNGELWAWGWNFSGQLGDGTSGTNVNVPAPKRIGENVNGYTQIAASPALGAFHSLALKNNGELWAWGLNADGRLGDGTKVNKNIPTRIGESVVGYTQISAGYAHSLALKDNGELWAWGLNVNGQLGDGTTTDVLTPKKIGDGYTQIAAGRGHSLALKDNGELWAWGLNANGQLGDGTTTKITEPKEIKYE
ncbi:hypothetical protein CHS0354_000820 [Potamilus streckersoni]|uniref:RCC1-like domain-containing protein n=1 Tax=Potamilus streckersoni TaxID=2493646 RepID=A0AAE0T7H0_9BIVA|nr:hypothetical protein CHS0354_000820 [Potamilus streckersoni]